MGRPGRSSPKRWNHTFKGTAIGVLPKRVGSIAYAINNKCQVIGSSGNQTSKQTAFFWERNKAGKGVLTALSPLGSHSFIPGFGFASIALGLNDSATIVGFSLTNSFQAHATLWQRHGTKFSVTDIHPAGAFFHSEALAINAKGFIAGVYTDKTSHLNGFVRGPFAAGKITVRNVGKLSGFTETTADAINAKLQVVGHADTALGVRHAFIWKPVGAKGRDHRSEHATSRRIRLGSQRGFRN